MLLFSKRPLDENCHPEWSPESPRSPFWKVIKTTSRETADHSTNSQKIPWFSVRTFEPLTRRTKWVTGRCHATDSPKRSEVGIVCCSFIFTGFGHPVKILQSQNTFYRLGLDDLSLRNDCWAVRRSHAEQPKSLIWCSHLLWPFDKMVRTELPSGLHSGLVVQAILADHWIATCNRIKGE